MPCYQPSSLPSGVTTTGRTGYTTEAECLAACKEGACCEGTTCSVKPACQCQGTGKTFKGVGTVCAAVNCGCCGNGESLAGLSASVTITWTYNTNPLRLGFLTQTCWPVASTTQTQFATWDQLVPTNISGDTGPCSKAFLDSSGGPPNRTTGSGLAAVRNVPPYTNIAIAPVAGLCQLSFYTAYANPGCSGNNAPLQIPFMTWAYTGPGTYTLTYYVWSLFRNRTNPYGTDYEDVLLRVSRNSLSAVAPPGDFAVPGFDNWYITATANVSATLV